MTELRRARARILFVEDDTDIRETLAELLRDEGYDVSEAGSAEEGLQLLQSERYHVLLSDYHLPGNNGTWMIEQARASGRLDGTTPLILSASAHLEGAEGVRLLSKPIDIDDLCREIAGVTTRDSGVHDVDPPEESATDSAARLPIELVLYVHGSAPSAARSRRSLEGVLRDYGLPESCLRVVDVSTADGVAAAEQAHVAFTPALQRVTPAPQRWIVGDLRQRAPLERLLRDSGVRRR